MRKDGLLANQRLVLYVLLLVLFAGCRGSSLRTDGQSPPNPQDVGAYLSPEIFATLDVQRDDAGNNYVLIDDMRFRVNGAETWGYQGRQWPNGSLNYEFSPEVRNDAAHCP